MGRAVYLEFLNSRGCNKMGGSEVLSGNLSSFLLEKGFEGGQLWVYEVRMWVWVWVGVCGRGGRGEGWGEGGKEGQKANQRS